MASQPDQQANQSEQRKQSLFEGYAGEGMPLQAYLVFLGAYLTTFVAFLLGLKSRRIGLPERMDPADILLFGIATHKVGRLITRDWVTSPLRAPFTRFEKSIGSGEVHEKARGTGLRLAMGQLLTCPWCIAPWVAAGLAYSWVFVPRLTRLIAGLFTMVVISDYLQHVYRAAKKLEA